MLKKLSKIKTTLLLALFGLSTKLVYATSPNGINTVDKNTMAQKIQGAVNNIFYVIGGIAIFVGFVMIGLELIFANKNPERRSSAMSSILYAGIGAAIMGAAAIIGGFFFNLLK